MYASIISFVLSFLMCCIAQSASASPGQLDTSFNYGVAAAPSFEGRANAVVRQPVDNQLIVAGSRTYNSSTEFVVARYTTGGALDSTFGGNYGGWVSTPVGSNAEALAVGLQSGGKIIAAGYSNAGSYDIITLVRYTTGGVLDETFGNQGVVKTTISASNNSRALGIAIDGSDRIVVVGYTDNIGFTIVRYSSDGVQDPAFGTNGIVTTSVKNSSDQATCVAIQGDGKIVAAGSSSDGYFLLTRFAANGELDSTFNISGKLYSNVSSTSAGVRGIALQTDGKIIVAGYGENNNNLDMVVMRFTDNGSVDYNTFGNSGKVTTDFNNGGDTAFGVAIQANGRIVVVGSSVNTYGGTEQFALLRLESNGYLDSSFGGNGKVLTSVNSASNSQARSVLIQPDGRIVAAGSYFSNGSDHFSVARYLGDIKVTFVAGTHGHIDGTLVQTVDINGATTAVTAVADSGYHFVNWTGTGGFVSTNSYLTLNNVTSEMTVTANFAADPLVTFVPGAGGSIDGTRSQTIAPNGQTAPVTALPDPHHHFVNWTGTGNFSPTTMNPLTIWGVMGDTTVTANFAIDSQNLLFTPGAGGSINGTTLQSVNYGGASTAVTAVADPGFVFYNWTGPTGFVTTTANPLTVSNVTTDMSIHANFRDVTTPLISAFTLPATSAGKNVTPVTVTATDNVAVTAYCFSEDNTTPTLSSSCWTPAIPTGFTFAGTGSRTLYLWVRDAAGNISSSRYATVTVQDTTAPTVIAYPAEIVFYDPNQSVTLLSNEPATIYYTTDGSIPTESSAVYSGPIPIPGSLTLKFFAKDRSGNSSNVQTAPYHVFTSPLPTTAISGPYGNITVNRLSLSPDYATDATVIAQASLMYISRDGGTTWSRLGDLGYYSDADFSPAYAADQTIFAAGAGAGGSPILFKSTDRGVTWNILSAMPEISTRLRVSPGYATDKTIFAFGYSSSYRSLDDGKNWVTMGGLPGMVLSVSFSPTYASDHTLAVGTGSGVYKSIDAGQSWTRINDSLAGSARGHAVAIAPDNSIFVSFDDGSTVTHNKIYKTVNNGATWTPSADLQMEFAYEIQVSPNYTTDHTLYASSYLNCIFKSTDSGVTWTNIKSDTTGTSACYAVAISPAFASDNRLFIGAYENGIAASANRGTSWTTASNGIERLGGSFTFSPAYATDHTLFFPVGGLDKVVKTANDGASWSSLSTLPMAPFALETSPAYASDSTLWATGYFHVYKSTNGGSSWTQGTTAAGYLNYKLVVSPAYVTDHMLFTMTSDRGIMKSIDGGDNWNTANIGITSLSSPDLALSPGFGTDQTGFAAAGNTLYKTTDSGANWGAVSSAGIISQVQLSPAYPTDHTVLGLTDSYTLRISTNGGTDWTDLPAVSFDGIADNAMAFAFSPAFSQDGTIFAAGAFGLYKLTIGESAWRNIPLAGFHRAGLGNYVYALKASPAFATDKTLFIQSAYDGILKVAIQSPDAPGIVQFTLPAISDTLSVGPITLNAVAKQGITGYCLREVNDAAGCTWTPSAPPSYPFATIGRKTLYSWVKDSLGTISPSASAITTVGTPLTVTIAGSGSGSIGGSIACATGTCTGAYSSGASVTLSAAPGAGAFFAGWSGACSGTGSCSVTMNGSTNVTATFTTALNVWNRTSGGTFSPLQAAYNAAQTDDVLLARTGTFTENLLLNRPVKVTVKGGYDAGYVSSGGMSTVQGKVVIQSGCLIANGLRIR